MDSRFCLSLKVRFSDCNEAAAKTAEATVLEMLLKIEAEPPEDIAGGGGGGPAPDLATGISFCCCICCLDSPDGVLEMERDEDVEEEEDANALIPPPPPAPPPAPPTPISPTDLLVAVFSADLSVELDLDGILDERMAVAPGFRGG